MTSTHQVEVVRLGKILPHPNADRLEITSIYGFPSCVVKGQYKEGDLVAFVPPDNIVDTTKEEFAFLAPKAKADSTYRVKACKLRGSVSYGLIVPAPKGAKEGDDVASLLGVTHYEPPPEKGSELGGEQSEPGPEIYCPKYDLEAFRRYANDVFEEGEPVIVSEKIHGCNAKYTFYNGRMWCGSRTQWKREYPDMSHLTVESLLEKGVEEERAQQIVEKAHSKQGEKNVWWRILDQYPGLEKFCRENPCAVVFGEIYGWVQSLRYGHQQGEVSFAAFDILKDAQWMCAPEAVNESIQHHFPWVPLFHHRYYIDGEPTGIEPIEYSFDKLCELAEGQSTLPKANHIREGIVIQPLYEKTHYKIGRVKLKLVSAAYLENC